MGCLPCRDRFGGNLHHEGAACTSFVLELDSSTGCFQEITGFVTERVRFCTSVHSVGLFTPTYGLRLCCGSCCYLSKTLTLSKCPSEFYSYGHFSGYGCVVVDLFALTEPALRMVNACAPLRQPGWPNMGCSVRIADEGRLSLVALGAAPRTWGFEGGVKGFFLGSGGGGWVLGRGAPSSVREGLARIVDPRVSQHSLLVLYLFCSCLFGAALVAHALALAGSCISVSKLLLQNV